MKKTIYSEEHKRLVGQLKKARKEAGLEQNEVAKLLAKTQSYISKIESGQRRVDFVQLKEFARIYKKSLNYFIHQP
jgi:transcriptional regulator with XRE-family HTH domain